MVTMEWVSLVTKHGSLVTSVWSHEEKLPNWKSSIHRKATRLICGGNKFWTSSFRFKVPGTIRPYGRFQPGELADISSRYVRIT